MATRHGTHDRGMAVIEIKHNGKTAHLRDRTNAMTVINYLRKNGIEMGEDDYVIHVLDHPLTIDGVRPITIDQAIEVLK